MNQYGRLQPRSNDNGGSALLDAGEEALAYPTQRSSGHPGHQTAFLEPAEVWGQFEVQRSSAEYHLNNYLLRLARSCEGSDDMPSASQGIAFISPLASCLFLT